VSCGGDIGRAQEVGEAIKKALVIASCPLADEDGLGAIFPDGLLEPLADGIQSLILGDAFPALVAFLHRVKNPIRVICQLRDGKPFGTHDPMADG